MPRFRALRSRGLHQLLLFLLLAAAVEMHCRIRLVQEGLERRDAVAVHDALTEWRMNLGHPVHGWGRFNSDGLRYEEVPGPAPAGTLRILCLGGSVTMGLGVEVESTYEVILQRLLAERLPAGQRVEVVNAGQCGFGTRHDLCLLSELWERYRPDIVIVACGYNEYDMSSFRESGLKLYDQSGWERQRLVGRLRNLLYASGTYRYLCRKLLPADEGRVDRGTPVAADREGGEAHVRVSCDNLCVMSGFLRREGVPMVLVVEVFRSDASLLRLHQRRADAVLSCHLSKGYTLLRQAYWRFGEAYDVPVVDMHDVYQASRIDEERFFQPDDPLHLTLCGNEVYAKAIARTLWEKGLVPTTR